VISGGEAMVNSLTHYISLHFVSVTRAINSMRVLLSTLTMSRDVSERGTWAYCSQKSRKHHISTAAAPKPHTVEWDRGDMMKAVLTKR